MIVYKFGGASVNSPGGVRNLCEIVRNAHGRVLVIVSAMGKTTNALEGVLESAFAGRADQALERLAAVERFHDDILAGLMGPGTPQPVADIYAAARRFVATHATHASGAETAPADYDRLYDELVGCGEMLSTTVISLYMSCVDISNHLLDMRRCMVTDARHRAADVLMEESALRLRSAATAAPERVLIGQGFIGATRAGAPTTLGREGSDYSAAVAANLLDASQVVIWKDVPGILNADPRLFPDARLIPELTYLDAVELAYSGAQVIHPKTIKPLYNKQIPLYVRPFADHSAPGSVIKGEMQGKIEIPILILKKGQVLVSIRPLDFSFVLQECTLDILRLFDENGVPVNLIQTSAVNLSLCVDSSRGLGEVVRQLQRDFRVVYNEGMELLTIRGYTPELYASYTGADGVYLSQRTRRIVRIVRKTT